MELDNGVIFGAVQALNELFQKEWPVKASLALAKLLKILNGPFEPIENVRNGLVQKHVSSPVALLDDAGERVSRGPDQMTPEHPNWEAFAVDFNELMVDTSEVEDFEKKMPFKLREASEFVKIREQLFSKYLEEYLKKI